MSIPGVAGLLNKVYYSLKLRHQNFPIIYVGMPVYRHLKAVIVAMEQLLVKACFEEAKIHELPNSNPKRTLSVTGS